MAANHSRLFLNSLEFIGFRWGKTSKPITGRSRLNVGLYIRLRDANAAVSNRGVSSRLLGFPLPRNS